VSAKQLTIARVVTARRPAFPLHSLKQHNSEELPQRAMGKPATSASASTRALIGLVQLTRTGSATDRHQSFRSDCRSIWRRAHRPRSVVEGLRAFSAYRTRGQGVQTMTEVPFSRGTRSQTKDHGGRVGDVLYSLRSLANGGQISITVRHGWHRHEGGCCAFRQNGRGRVTYSEDAIEAASSMGVSDSEGSGTEAHRQRSEEQ